MVIFSLWNKHTGMIFGKILSPVIARLISGLLGCTYLPKQTLSALPREYGMCIYGYIYIGLYDLHVGLDGDLRSFQVSH